MSSLRRRRPASGRPASRRSRRSACSSSIGKPLGVDTRELIHQLALARLVGLEDLGDRGVDHIVLVRVLRQQRPHGVDADLDQRDLVDRGLVRQVDVLARKREVLGRQFLRRDCRQAAARSQREHEAQQQRACENSSSSCWTILPRKTACCAQASITSTPSAAGDIGPLAEAEKEAVLHHARDVAERERERFWSGNAAK